MKEHTQIKFIIPDLTKEEENMLRQMAIDMQKKFEEMTISALMGCIHGEYEVVKDKELP